MAYAITDDGIEIYYEAKGQGLPVIFVSGYFGISDIWQAQTDALSEKFRTVSYDSRGYGRSAKPLPAEAYSIPRHADDLKAVIDAAGINGPAVLVSHSIGCNIISTFAVKYPQQVAGLVYTACYVDGKQMRDAGMSVEGVSEAVSTPSGAVAFYKPFGVTESVGAEAAKWATHALQANAAAFLNHEMADQYSAITAPALILQGENDAPNPLTFATALQQVLGGGAELKVLKGVNHFPPLEAPETVTAFVEEHARKCFAD
ncbi:alpha/beta fold hydrolase [Leclercia sp. GLN_9]|uniref:alpha/beta fold hydrolase n=1 Tax=Leclercia sp. GLN_9 TaxID=3367184 RepID=UPI00370B303A